MPQTTVLFYQEKENESEVVDWLSELRKTMPKAFAKCMVRVQRLAEIGHELRRPEADLLRDGIYGLRARLGKVNYRLLYFFHGSTVAVIACGLTKEAAVPASEISSAIKRKEAFLKQPMAHTFKRTLS